MTEGGALQWQVRAPCNDRWGYCHCERSAAIPPGGCQKQDLPDLGIIRITQVMLRVRRGI